MPRPSSRNAILEAAEAIVAECGAAHMTLDAVAKRCGVSKGGLIYNFPTKEALIDGMLARHMARMDELRAHARKSLASRDPNELMVEISVALALREGQTRLHSALLAVIANEPSLMARFRDQARARFKEATESGGGGDRAAILFFAAFGLHFHDLLELGLVDDAQRAHLEEALLELGSGDNPLPPADAPPNKRKPAKRPATAARRRRP